ncbi:hypothetical protein KUTeg_005664 [Tegillarca granosa]|uniref:G-protein coupled receptors family 2 profile 2 domain-containing protein n=1 Tax=Tegillarca granosa TaxID=220873 RepID=A0ABQ9FPW0_TEGGR|nr:hypothetical protein KUTeg_005664 [Tegillarca granosa]
MIKENKIKESATACKGIKGIRSLSSERVYVHRNLCFAIVAAQVSFLAGIKAVHYKIVCSCVALVLHYFYTAVFVWMLVEGLHLYSKVVQVFGTEKSRAIYYFGFGWVLVTISATADWDGYGTIWAFVGPALAVILVNVVILWMVVRIVMSSAKLENNNEFDHIRAGVKGAMFLLPLLGLTWTFGLLAVKRLVFVLQIKYLTSTNLNSI